MNCNVCNSTNLELKFKEVEDLEYLSYQPVDFYRCQDCGLLIQNPLPLLENVIDFYPENYRNYLPVDGSNLFAAIKKDKFKKQAKHLLKNFSGGARILEIGYGNGELLKALSTLGCGDLSGCDFSDKNKASLEAYGIKIQVANVEEELPFAEKFDVIILNNVIEHFLNPIAVLQNCYQHLNPDGKIILFTPNSDALELEIFGKFWAGFHAPRHTFVFNKVNLKILASRIGFNRTYFGIETDPGQWAISVQNYLQSKSFTRTKLKNGLASYTVLLAAFFIPFTWLQNFLYRPANLFVILEK